jgi:small GTP-binding protein
MTRKRKVCLIGATAVGKTSLVGRYVTSIFSESYHTTIGVKIESRVVTSKDREVDLVIWDLSGEDEFQNVQPSYLRGASGYLLVIDGSRRSTLDVAMTLESRVRAAVGVIPFVAVLNKIDLVAEWQLAPADVETMRSRGWLVVRASAKTGEGVDEAFERLVDRMAEERRPWL